MPSQHHLHGTTPRAGATVAPVMTHAPRDPVPLTAAVPPPLHRPQSDPQRRKPRPPRRLKERRLRHSHLCLLPNLLPHPLLQHPARSPLPHLALPTPTALPDARNKKQMPIVVRLAVKSQRPFKRSTSYVSRMLNCSEQSTMHVSNCANSHLV